MVVSIHQPQYLPWLPYLTKISESDVFIVLDSVDYHKNGIQNRNKIKTAQGASWLTVPVKHKLGQKIVEIEINKSVDWRKKHWNTIVQNYGKANAFKTHLADLENIYFQDWNLLVDINMSILDMLLRWMNIKTKVLRSSQMKAHGRASDLIINLCLEVGANSYISGTGGKNYLDEVAFKSAGIAIDYRPPIFPSQYPQQHSIVGFLNDLSALDILLNCGENWGNYVDFYSPKNRCMQL